MAPSSEILWCVRMSKLCLESNKYNLVVYFFFKIKYIMELLILKAVEDRQTCVQF